jgi:hypothetical protein
MQILAECDELATDVCQFATFGQVFLQGFAAGGGNVFEDGVEGLEGGQQCGGGFGSDLGDSGYIVDGVTDE